MRRIQIVILIYIVLSMFGCLNKSFINTSKEPQKLLFYATIHDSLKIFTNDSTWIENAPCIELKIDTINTSEIIKNKKKDIYFKYRGHSFLKSQLFSLTEYEHLKKYFIHSFSFGSTIIRTISIPHYEGNCFQDNHLRKTYKTNYTEFMKELRWVSGRIYLNVTVISDKGDKMILDGLELTLIKN